MTHYDVLQVSRDASAEEIKRAFRTLSLKWHPDRNSSPDAISKFQEISSAYEILSDDAKRREYNCELDGGQEVDLSDIINMMFGNPGGPFGHTSRQFGFGGMPFAPGSGMPQGLGSMPQGLGSMPQGLGSMPQGLGSMRFGPGGPEIHVFHSQNMPSPDGPFGHPLFRQFQKPPPIMKQIELTFEQAYAGCTICVEIEKWVIQNDMKIHEIEQVYVSIPAGIDQNELIIMRDCGNTVNPDLKGDIKFIVKIGESALFERQGMDLLHKRSITLKEALTGFSFELLHVSGKTLCLNNLKNRTIIAPNYRKTIPNLGMMRDRNVGNLIIEFNVVFPEQLTEDQTLQLMAIL
jgi:DnaJ-class molecular chaperone